MRLVTVFTLLLCATALALEAPPRYVIAFPPAEDWKSGYSQEVGGEYIVEYTQGGESVEAWSQLVTCTYRRLPKKKFDDLMRLTLDNLKHGCPSFKHEVLEEKPFKLVYRWSHEGCRGWPGQEVVTRYEYVDGGVLNLQYAYVRGKATPDFSAWVRLVSGATTGRGAP